MITPVLITPNSTLSGISTTITAAIAGQVTAAVAGAPLVVTVPDSVWDYQELGYNSTGALTSVCISASGVKVNTWTYAYKSNGALSSVAKT